MVCPPPQIFVETTLIVQLEWTFNRESQVWNFIQSTTPPPQRHRRNPTHHPSQSVIIHTYSETIMPPQESQLCTLLPRSHISWVSECKSPQGIKYDKLHYRWNSNIKLVPAPISRHHSTTKGLYCSYHKETRAQERMRKSTFPHSWCVVCIRQ